MLYPLGLFSYRLSQKQTPTRELPDGDKPKDPVVWAVVDNVTSLRAFLTIAQKLESRGHDIHLLISAPEHVRQEINPSKGVTLIGTPGEKDAETQNFIRQWSPVLCFWNQEVLMPGLIVSLHGSGVPIILLGVKEHSLFAGASRLKRYLIRKIIPLFHSIYTETPEAEAVLTRYGAPKEKITVRGHLSEGVAIEEVDTLVMDRLSTSLAGRGMWFAVHVPEDEIDTVLRAHSLLRAKNRRLLLILAPRERMANSTLAIALIQKGWRVAVRSNGDEITDQTQIVLADRADEVGIWYRLAPISFLGGAYLMDQHVVDPRPAAGLGSAIVHGPRTAPYRQIFDGLHDMTPAGATQVVNKDNLANSIEELLSPDIAAAQSLAAWEYVTRGAELMDQLIELIETQLDERDQTHA